MNSIDTHIPPKIVKENQTRLIELMARDGFDAVVVFHPSNMLALVGTPHASSDRLTCAVVTRAAGVHVICPAFEHPGLTAAEPHATIHTWLEHEDPYRVLADRLGDAGLAGGRVGVDGRTWLAAWRRFCDVLDPAHLCDGEALLREVRLIKTPGVQDALRRAHDRGERVFLELGRLIEPGISELDLARRVAAVFADQGLAVHPYIQSGPNGAVPHHETGQRKLQPGDTIVVDSVTLTDGFHNDLTRTFAIGDPGPKAREAYRTVRAAQQAAIDAARPGLTCAQLDAAAREVIEQAGFGEFFVHRLGHGIGIEVHEPPYLVGGNEEPLRPGMCVTVEPGIYVPGAFGIRIEDEILITDTGCERIAGQLPTDVSDAFAG